MAKTVEHVVLPSYPHAMYEWELRSRQDKPPTACGVSAAAAMWERLATAPPGARGVLRAVVRGIAGCAAGPWGAIR